MLASFFARRGVHYGVPVVATIFLAMLTMAGALGLPSALIIPVSEEFNWSIGEISGALALRLALFGAMAPFAAALIERYGVRRMVVVAASMVSFGFLASLFMHEFWQLVVLWGVVVGVGSGLTAMVLGATIAGRWFEQQRGLVLGILTASTATGQLAFLPFGAWIVEHVGWRLAVAPAVGACLFAALLVVLIVRDRPADVGLRPFGATQDPPAPVRPTQSPLRTAADALILASRSRTFWILFGTFFICGLSTNGLVQTHFISLCGDYGMAATVAASVLALMGLCDIVGTIASGWLSDRFDNRWLLFWYYGLRGLALMFLPFSGFSGVGLLIFAVFCGLDWIATVPPTVRLTAATFGAEKAPLVFGWIFVGHQLGAATAAFAAGAIRTSFDTYLPAFFIAGAVCLVAAMAVLTINRLRPAPATEATA